MTTPQESNGILLYDYLVARGGAEKLSFSLLNGLKRTDFCVAMKDDGLFPEMATKVGGEERYVLSKYTGAKGWRTLKTIFIFLLGNVFRKKYDWIIYSGQFAPIAILRNRKMARKNILYCHTIPRAPYDLKEFKLSQMGFFTRMAFHLICWLIKLLYEPSIRKMDVVVANSENVRRRIQKYLGIDAVVVNPPIDVHRFKWLGQGDYYLSTARLEPAKRVDAIVRAFMSMPDKNLIVASGGSEYERLSNMAKGYTNIRFLGWTSDQQLYETVGNCIATIYIPVDEDFGMSPVESMSAGKPVIGSAEGGILETVISGKTGILIHNPTSEKIVETIVGMAKEDWLAMRQSCEGRAKLFSEEKFIKNISDIVRLKNVEKIADEDVLSV